jgi:hypothetical protein
MLRTQNMAEVPDQGEVQDEGPYLVRVSKVEEEDDAGNPLVSESSGGEKVIFVLKIQDEGKWLGSQVRIHASLQAHALFNLKAIYTACGYKPGPEGHDPQSVLDGEFYIYIKHKDYENPNTGEKRTVTDIPVWGIRSLSAGPAQPKNK